MSHYDEELNVLGLRCPLPLLEAKKKLARMAAGEVLKVMADDPSSVIDFKSYATVANIDLIQCEKIENIFYFYIQKTAGENAE